MLNIQMICVIFLQKRKCMSIKEQNHMDSDFKQLLESRDALLSSMKDGDFFPVKIWKTSQIKIFLRWSNSRKFKETVSP